MKYSPETYAQAFIKALESTPEKERDKIVKRFLGILAKNGDLKRGEKIINLIGKYLTKKAGGRNVEIELARKLPEKLIEEILKKFGEKDRIKISVNPGLVAGIRITIDGERELDVTLAKKLKKLF